MNFDRRLGKLDYGSESRPLAYPEYPFGGNMSFKCSIIEKIGGFSVNLGLKGRKLLGNDENEFFFRINQFNDKYTIFYNPSALVYHNVRSQCYKPSYFIIREYCRGISDAILKEKAEDITPTRSRWIKRGIYTGFRALVSSKTILKGFLRFDKYKVLKGAVYTAYQLGYSKECFCIGVGRLRD